MAPPRSVGWRRVNAGDCAARMRAARRRPSRPPCSPSRRCAPPGLRPADLPWLQLSRSRRFRAASAPRTAPGRLARLRVRPRLVRRRRVVGLRQHARLRAACPQCWRRSRSSASAPSSRCIPAFALAGSRSGWGAASRARRCPGHCRRLGGPPSGCAARCSPASRGSPPATPTRRPARGLRATRRRLRRSAGSRLSRRGRAAVDRRGLGTRHWPARGRGRRAARGGQPAVRRADLVGRPAANPSRAPVAGQRAAGH